MTPSAVKDGTAQSLLMPEDGNHITLPSNETFGIISQSALKSLRKKGEFLYNGILWRKTGETDTSLGSAVEVEDAEEGAKMTILNDLKLPLILSMANNPVEINWTLAP